MAMTRSTRPWVGFITAAMGVGVSLVVVAGPASAQGARMIEPVLLPSVFKGQSVAVGDMDNDGIVDLIRPTAGGGVSLMRGLGDGLFGPPGIVAHPAPGGYLTDCVVGDFDGDGILDFAVTRAGPDPSGVVVLRGLGDGRLGMPVTYAGPVPYKLRTADVNGDGDLDLISVSYGDNVVSVLLGGAGLGFTAAAPVPVGQGPLGLELADVNGDGHLDFAVANQDSNSVSLRYGDGTGGFPSGAEVPTRPAPQDVDLSDLNQDGVMDLIVGSNGPTSQDNATLAVLQGTGPATFSEVRTYEVLPYVQSVTAADFDADGYLDVVVGTGANVPFSDRSAPGYVTVIGGRPGSTDNIVVAKVGATASDVNVADLDQDGDLDIVTTRGQDFLAAIFDPLA